jgi:hypothetical protein
MRIAVSTIMKDEPVGFVERWVESAMDATELCITDTGSTETECVTAARDLGVTVHEIRLNPFRFDIARNAALALVPNDVDVVVKLDMDEVLAPGWRDALENAPRAARYSYDYIWNFTPDGQPDVRFAADHTISRHGWNWKHPVHESLQWAGLGAAPEAVYAPFTIEHHADPEKPRTSYLPLLARAIHESPEDDRMAHYYARELFFRGMWDEARKQFMRHLSLPTATWSPERAQSYRYLAKMDDYPERWLLKAVAEDPSRREAWVDLVDMHMSRGMLPVAAGYAVQALSIDQRPTDYMSEAHAWNNERLYQIIESTGFMTVMDPTGDAGG